MKGRVVLWSGILAMILLVCGVFLPAGSLGQKVLFIIGAPTLYWVAVVNKQNVFIALQLVVTLGAFLAFMPQMPSLWRYLIMIMAVLVAVIWLETQRGFRYWGVESILGVLGLSLIAIGLATPPSLYPALFFASLSIGGILVAITAGISIENGFQLGWIWLILNLLFAWNPTVQVLRMIR